MTAVDLGAFSLDLLSGEVVPEGDASLLGRLLTETLLRHEGPELAALVARVGKGGVGKGGEVCEGRHHRRSVTAAPLEDLDVAQTIRLVRALSASFHLSNLAEQTCRVDDLADTGRRQPGPLQEAIDRICDAAVPEELVAQVLGRLELRPVFTAHPTEAARRSVLTTLRLMADMLGSGRIQGSPGRNALEWSGDWRSSSTCCG